jgi:NB-ARC domain
MLLNSTAEVVSWIEQQVLSKSGRQLSDREKLIVAGAWEDISYSKLAGEANCTPSYLRINAVSLWKLLTETLGNGVEVGKKNLRAVLEEKCGIRTPSSQTILVNNEREQELRSLEREVVNNRCVVITGVPGVGKTSIATALVERLRKTKKFDFVHWKAIHLTTTVNDLVITLNQSLSINASGNHDHDITRLLNKLKSLKCLIVLDGLENYTGIFRSFNPSSEFDHFIRRFAEESMNSCLLITSQSCFPGFSLLKSLNLPVSVHNLQGLSISSCKQIMREKGLSGEESWDILIKAFHGNPKLINLAANRVTQEFGGDVSKLFEYGTYLSCQYFIEICEKYFENKSFENQIALKVLGILGNRKFTLNEIIDQLKNQQFNISYSELIQILQELESCFLVEISDNPSQQLRLYSIPAVAQQYLFQGHIASSLNLHSQEHV